MHIRFDIPFSILLQGSLESLVEYCEDFARLALACTVCRHPAVRFKLDLMQHDYESINEAWLQRCLSEETDSTGSIKDDGARLCYTCGVAATEYGLRQCHACYLSD